MKYGNMFNYFLFMRLPKPEYILTYCWKRKYLKCLITEVKSGFMPIHKSPFYSKYHFAC